jgi:hypothetical protein
LPTPADALITTPQHDRSERADEISANSTSRPTSGHTLAEAEWVSRTSANSNRRPAALRAFSERHNGFAGF